MLNCSAVLELLPVASPQWQEQRDSCPGEEQLQAGSKENLPAPGAPAAGVGGKDTTHVLAVGLSSCLYQLSSRGSQLVLAAAPEAGLWLGGINPLGWAGVVAPAPWCCRISCWTVASINRAMMGEVVGTC